MIDEILSSLDINFPPVAPGDDFVDKYSSEKALFEEIERCLHSNGIRSGYTLGRFGEHEAYALFRYKGYWIVSFSERRENYVKGVFNHVFNAVNLFLSLLLDSNSKYFDWKRICS
jgi:hypothetical protein